MDHIADMDKTDLANEMPIVGTAHDGRPAGPDVQGLADPAEAECEIAALSQAAGIDSSSLTDIQIMEALYQLR